MEQNLNEEHGGEVVRRLPDVKNLYANIELAAKNNELNILVNQNPKKQWIKTNPFANDSKYIPIHVVEYLLTSIFTKWRVEVKDYKVIANSIGVCVRLHYLDPITGEWDWQDGLGAAPIQTAAGKPISMEYVNYAAVQMSLPAAESFAFKDAAEKIGKLFGKDLNRKDLLDLDKVLHSKKSKFESDNGVETDSERLHRMMKACTNVEQLKNFHKNCKTATDKSLYEDLMIKLPAK